MVTLKASSGTNLAFGRAGKDADVIVQLNERLKAVQAENQLLGRLLKDFQAGKGTVSAKSADVQSKPHNALQTAAQAAKQLDELQHKLAAAQQEQTRLKNSARAQQNALDKSQAMQNDMADVLLSMQQECEQKSRQLSTATKRMAVLNNKFKQVEGQLEEEKQQTALLQQQASQQEQTLDRCSADNDRLRTVVAQLQHQLQTREHHHDSEVNSNAETYQALQARHQALQASLAEQAVSSAAIQQQLEQKLASAEEELQTASQERTAAEAGLQALQLCEEKAKCSLHVGLTQIGEVRQQLVEAQRQCSQQQATVLQLHDQLLTSRHQLQETEKKLADHRAATCLVQQYAALDIRQHSLGSADNTPLLLPSSSSVSDSQQPQTSAEATDCKQVVEQEINTCNACGTAARQLERLHHELTQSRDVEVGVMRSLQRELCRVHVLERMCLSDLTEINTLHHQLHASQQAAWALRECVLKSAASSTYAFGVLTAQCSDLADDFQVTTEI